MYFRNLSYRRNDLFKCLAWLAVLIVASKASKGMAAVAYLPLVFFLLMAGRVNALYFCVLSMISFMIGNPFFFPKTTISFACLRGTLMLLAGCLSLKIFGKKNSPYVTPLLGIFPYLIFMFATACFGWCPIVSYLKLILYSFVFLALYAIANEVLRARGSKEELLRAAILSMACVFVLGSLALRPFPGISLMNIHGMTIEQLQQLKSLYRGMSNHSQCLGPVVAVIATFVMGDLLFSVKRFDPVYIAIMLASPILVYWTRSRTAMGTFLVGQMMLVWFFMNDRMVVKTWKHKVMSKIVPLAILGLIAVMCMPAVQEGINKFIFKWGDNRQGGTVENVLSSRMGLIERSLYNFRQSPMIGNGFQVSEEMAYEERKEFRELLSAPVEKGVWIYAVLEEGGVVGLILFSGFLIIAFFKLKRQKQYITATMLAVVAVSNMGEFSFFSMSYAGGMQWAMIFAAAVMDGQRLKKQAIEYDSYCGIR